CACTPIGRSLALTALTAPTLPRALHIRENGLSEIPILPLIRRTDAACSACSPIGRSLARIAKIAPIRAAVLATDSPAQKVEAGIEPDQQLTRSHRGLLVRKNPARAASPPGEVRDGPQSVTCWATLR